MSTRTLTDLELRILAFEKEWPLGKGGKASATRDTFGWSLTAYEQKLQRLLSVPAALAAEPMLVHRSNRLRDAKARARASRRWLGPIQNAG